MCSNFLPSSCYCMFMRFGEVEEGSIFGQGHVDNSFSLKVQRHEILVVSCPMEGS